MKKVLRIGLKDVILAFRDRPALLLMLAAPFVLTLGLGFVTGAFTGTSTSGVSDIPVVVVNQDGGTLGNELVQVLQSPEMAGLLAVTAEADPLAARRMVDGDKAAAAILVPPGFTQSILSRPGAQVVQIVLYTNPTRPTSVGVVRTVMDGFVSQVEAARVGGQVAAEQLLASGRIQPTEAAGVAARIAGQVAAAANAEAIPVRSQTGTGEQVPFNAMAYMAPGMALMFLMFTTTNGGRTLLVERALGTLPRLLVTPTSTTQVLGGKVIGIYTTGVAQLLILIGASTLLFGLHWGQPLTVLVLVLACVAGAVGWGILITAIGRTPGQVTAIGSAIMLIFGILGGSFFNLENMPDWYRALSKITPNAWGLAGFTTLAQGGGMADILVPVVALWTMGVVLFGIAVVLLGRRGLAEG
jgi:ABC-2 type transport system permease protein